MCVNFTRTELRLLLCVRRARLIGQLVLATEVGFVGLKGVDMSKPYHVVLELVVPCEYSCS
jgi:hypothetical protein